MMELKPEHFEQLRQLLLNDPEIRKAIVKKLAEDKKCSIDPEDPPGWLEDALANFVDWVIERAKEVWEPLSEVLGSSFTEVGRYYLDGVMSHLDPGTMPTQESAMESASRFLSFSFGIAVSTVLLSVLGQLIPGVSTHALSRLVDWWYWGLGLGFMGWQIIAPVTRTQILNPLEDAYNVKYPTRRLTWSRVFALYRDGIITKEQAVRQLTLEGFTEEVRNELLAQAEAQRAERIKMDRPAPWGRAIRAYREGKITREELVKVLQLHRFDRDAIDIILKTADREKEREILFSPEFSVETQALRRRSKLLKEWLEEIKQYLKIEEVERRLSSARATEAKLLERAKVKEFELDSLKRSLEKTRDELYLELPEEELELRKRQLQGALAEYDKLKDDVERIEGDIASELLSLEVAKTDEERGAIEASLKEKEKALAEVKALMEVQEAKIVDSRARLYRPLPSETIEELLREEERMEKAIERLDLALRALYSQIQAQRDRISLLEQMLTRYPELEDLVNSLEAMEERTALMMMDEVYDILQQHDLLVKEHLTMLEQTTDELLERLPPQELRTSLELLREGRDRLLRERRLTVRELAPRPPPPRFIPRPEEMVVHPPLAATLRTAWAPGVPFHRTTPYEVPVSIPRPEEKPPPTAEQKDEKTVKVKEPPPETEKAEVEEEGEKKTVKEVRKVPRPERRRS